MKYNANGGQRRSKTEKIYISGNSTVKCRLCEKTETRLSVNMRDWEMQHMHFSDGDLEFMTCPKCKTINPMDMLEQLGELNRMTNTPAEKK